MRIRGIVTQRGAWRHGFALGCLVVLGLIVAHLALMTSERHAEVMAPHHGLATTALLLPLFPAAGPADAHAPMPDAPNTVLGDCPAQQAVIPTLILFLTMCGAVIAAAPRLTPTGGQHHTARIHPPPLAAVQRRALLQVFLI